MKVSTCETIALGLNVFGRKERQRERGREKTNEKEKQMRKITLLHPHYSHQSKQMVNPLEPKLKWLFSFL